MISDRALDAAVADGVLSAGQVARLRAIEAGYAAESVDDESLRFITGFADIFVTIGIVLFLGALAFLMGLATTAMYAGLTLCSWLLAEFFTLKRRMALPSIALLAAFAGAGFMLALQIATAALPPSWQLHDGATLGDMFQSASALMVAAIATAGLCGAHYLRFRVPITIAAGVAALCILLVVIGMVALRPTDAKAEIVLNATLFVCGLLVFALAMRFDMSDPQRQTRRTDIAFWLHLLAAPLIVHPLIRGFLHGFDTTLTVGAAVGILCVFTVLAFVAVVVDRRAMLVSGLVYAGIASASLIRGLGFASSDRLVPIVLLALGAFILLLSAGWQPLRRALLRRLPGSLAARLPHPLALSRS